MFRLKFVLTMLLALSISVSGFPARAQPACPGAMTAQTQQMDMTGADQGCKDCTVTGKAAEDKAGCCNDDACSAQCSAAGSVAGNTLPEAWRPLSVSAEKFPMTDAVLSSLLPRTQDPPPKHLL